MIHKAAAWVNKCIIVRRGAKRCKNNGKGRNDAEWSGETRHHADGETTCHGEKVRTAEEVRRYEYEPPSEPKANTVRNRRVDTMIRHGHA